MTATVLVLGATSAIAAAYCRRLAAAGTRFVLVARNAARLEAVAADLKARGAGAAVTVVLDLAAAGDPDLSFRDLCGRLGFPDQVLLAYGMLGPSPAAETTVPEMRRIIDTNFTSAALWLQAAARLLPKDRPRTLIVVGSVAGDRGRRSNYAYGAAKAGLDALAEGLRHRLFGTPLHVLTVKPGFVDTPMTAHLDRGGPLWASPEKIAADIEKAVRQKRNVVYTPWFWSLIMRVVRSLPRPLFYRTDI